MKVRTASATCATRRRLPEAHGHPGAGHGHRRLDLHEHAVPALYGIYSPYGFNTGYLKQVYAQTVKRSSWPPPEADPATIRVGTANAPWLGGGDVAEGNEFEGWRSGTGRWCLVGPRRRTARRSPPTSPTRPTRTSSTATGPDRDQPHADADLTDFPSYTEPPLEQRLGGWRSWRAARWPTRPARSRPTCAEPRPAACPWLPPGPGVRRHCRDGPRRGHVALGPWPGATPLTSAALGGAEQYVVSPVTNPAVSLLDLRRRRESGRPGAPIGQLTHLYPPTARSHRRMSWRRRRSGLG